MLIPASTQQLDLISVEFEALGLNSFTPQGPAGVLALFTTPGQDLKVSQTEFYTTRVIVLDSR
mgnify:FL=1